MKQVAQKEPDKTDSSTLEQLKKTAHDLELLLDGARTVLENDNFEKSARKIFDYCRMVTRARSGYVALLSKDGQENQVLFLESGGLPCTVDPELPMPIRGLREVAYRTGKAVYDNDFRNSNWWDFLPSGHVGFANVMFAPLVIGGKAVGLVGLANKPSDFTENDIKLVTAFSEVAALALQRSLDQQEIRSSEERYHDLFESISDGIIIADLKGQIIDVNNTIMEILGYTSNDLLSMTLMDLHLDSAESLLAMQANSWPKELILLKKDGSRINANVKIWVQIDNAGDPERIYASVHDITLEKLSELQDRIYQKELEFYTSLIRHDLGNDLQIINSSLEISQMLLPDNTDIERMELINAGNAAINRMDNLLNALSRPSSWTENNITEFFERIISNSRKVHPNVNISFQISEASNACSIVTSRLLPTVFENLIRNAATYAGSKPSITIDVSKTDDMVEIVFSDDGPGIPSSIRTDLFKKGVSTAGRGMGLYLSKSICQACGGSIRLLPQEENHGAKFLIQMPIA